MATSFIWPSAVSAQGLLAAPVSWGEGGGRLFRFTCCLQEIRSSCDLGTFQDAAGLCEAVHSTLPPLCSFQLLGRGSGGGGRGGGDWWMVSLCVFHGTPQLRELGLSWATCFSHPTWLYQHSVMILQLRRPCASAPWCSKVPYSEGKQEKVSCIPTDASDF